MSKRKLTLAQRQAEMAARHRGEQPLWGRPPKRVNQEKLYRLAFYGAKNSEIARQLDCDPRSLARYAKPIAFARARASARVKRALYRRAVVDKHWRSIKRLLLDFDIIWGWNEDHKFHPQEVAPGGPVATANQGSSNPASAESFSATGGNIGGKSPAGNSAANIPGRPAGKARVQPHLRRGGPRQEFNSAIVHRLAYLGYSDKEIARELRCSVRTLRARCAEELARARQLEAADTGEVNKWVAQLDQEIPALIGQEDLQAVAWGAELAAYNRWQQRQEPEETTAAMAAPGPFVRRRKPPKSRINSATTPQQTNGLTPPLAGAAPPESAPENIRPADRDDGAENNQAWQIFEFDM